MSFNKRCRNRPSNRDSCPELGIPQQILVIVGLIVSLTALGWAAGTTNLTILHTSYDMGYVEPCG